MKMSEKWELIKSHLKEEIETFLHEWKEQYRLHYNPAKLLLYLSIVGLAVLFILWGWIKPPEPTPLDVPPPSNTSSEPEKGGQELPNGDSDTRGTDPIKISRETARDFLKEYFTYTEETFPSRFERVKELVGGNLFQRLNTDETRPIVDSSKVIDIQETMVNQAEDKVFWQGEMTLETRTDGKKAKETYRIGLLIGEDVGAWRVLEVYQESVDESTDGLS